ncbi:hypothetical protein V1L54_08370 [Streptomyces sp. TRM 70361]|uniref:hypothetical protein n=1 Tax=Streptomyces sp. TRM 70361 TaxID=3116553 RepID=UPI002E7BAD09|nr:hypothetical protein [Streptomyces sp. TRM 70361]MEE1939429.1 hypothetical protein [Streptomyces sp. TRM 70361]
MSSSDPNNPYRKNPYDSPSDHPPGHGPDGPSSGHPLAPPPGPYGSPGGPPGTMPGKVNSARLILYIAGGIQALFSLLAIVVFAASQNTLEETYGELNVDTGVYYVMFGFFLLHALVGIALATRFPQGGSGLRIGAIVWAAVLVLIGIAAIPLGLLWMAVGVFCLVLLASAESAAWFNRPQA